MIRKIKNPYESFTKNDLLGLDMAIHTGYYCMNGGGTWDFSKFKTAKENNEHKAFRNRLIDFIEENNIKLITAEDLIYMPGRFNALRKLGEYRGVLLEVCETLDLPAPIFIPPSHIKITATNKGNATKEEVMKGIKKLYGIDTNGDDNWADAIGCFYTTVNKYHLL